MAGGDQRLLHRSPGSEDRLDGRNRADVVEWIATNGEQVGVGAGGEAAFAPGEPDRARGYRRRGAECFAWGHADLVDEVDQRVREDAVGFGGCHPGVAARDDPRPGLV